MQHTIQRTIEIDAGHRVPTHGSQCRPPHGHRYRVVATCIPDGRGLHKEGEEAGMIMDFGFLKQEMHRVIHQPCDHAFLMWVGDSMLPGFLKAGGLDPDKMREEIPKSIEKQENRLVDVSGLKLYIMDSIPTAENLAEHWFGLLHPQITQRSEGWARLTEVAVYETPNNLATYGEGDG